ncbi:hypothetical protein D3C86_1190070 [compost metagenome]
MITLFLFAVMILSDNVTRSIVFLIFLFIFSKKQLLFSSSNLLNAAKRNEIFISQKLSLKSITKVTYMVSLTYISSNLKLMMYSFSSFVSFNEQPLSIISIAQILLSIHSIISLNFDLSKSSHTISSPYI